MLACLVSQAPAFAQNNGLPDGKALKKRISVSWDSADLAGALNTLNRNQGVPIFLDRRVDPGQKIEFRKEDTPVGAIIYQLADQIGCGVCWLGDVAYVGPRDDVARLILLRESLIGELNGMPGTVKRKWLAKGKLEYPRLSCPVDLYARELQRLDLPEDAEAKDKLPHDLWADGNFPAMRAVDRLILISFGFGRWPGIEQGRYAGLVVLPDDVPGQANFRISAAHRTAILNKLESGFAANIRSEKNRVIAEGDPETLYQIRQLIAIQEFAGQRSGTESSGGTEVISGRVKGSIGSALKTVADGLGVELQYDPSLRPILLQQIDLNAVRVTHQELAGMVLENTGLDYTLSDKVLLIREKAP